MERLYTRNKANRATKKVEFVCDLALQVFESIGLDRTVLGKAASKPFDPGSPRFQPDEMFYFRFDDSRRMQLATATYVGQNGTGQDELTFDFEPVLGDPRTLERCRTELNHVVITDMAGRAVMHLDGTPASGNYGVPGTFARR